MYQVAAWPKAPSICRSMNATRPRTEGPARGHARSASWRCRKKAGFVPNVFLALARRPAEWRAFFAYHDALMLKEKAR
jgi:alkylhydroperoxidase family enzyme